MELPIDLTGLEILTPFHHDSSPKKQIKDQYFLGPVSWKWLQTAANTPGKSLHLSIVILHLGKLQGSFESIHIQPKMLRKFGVERNAGYRALKNLEANHLIKIIERKRGKAATIRIENHMPLGWNTGERP